MHAITTVLATPAIVSVCNSRAPRSIADGFRMNRVATSNGYFCQREPAIRIFARYQSVYAPSVGHYEVEG